MARPSGSAILNQVFDAITKTLKVKVTAVSPGGLATADNQVTQITAEQNCEALLTTIDADTGALAGKDFATQTTLTAINNKVTVCNTGAIVGSVTANAGTNLNTSALALESGGNLASLKTNTDAGTPQYGTDDTGADTYVTIITAATAKRHIYIYNAGTYPVIISLNGGTTDHLRIPGEAAATFDAIAIGNGAAVQAKNGTPGSNYTDLSITIW